MSEFQVTEDDVENVLSSNALSENAMAFLCKDGESIQSMAREIFRELDFDAVKNATKGFAFLDEQIDHGHAEIERQLRCRGTLKPLPLQRQVDRQI